MHIHARTLTRTQGGIVAMDTHPQKPSIVATAGLDGAAKLFDYALNKQLASLEGHAKRLTGEGGCAL